MVNISGRGAGDQSSNLIAGFVVGGTGSSSLAPGDATYRLLPALTFKRTLRSAAPQ